MKIGVVRQDKDTEVCSTCSMEAFLEKVKKENKGKYISQLRERLPSLQGSDARFAHLDKIPRIYPVAEYRRTSDGTSFREQKLAEENLRLASVSWRTEWCAIIPIGATCSTDGF